ncbi:MAG: hypothetical protein H6579_03855 [Chitinophagales bacterium]|nr:hypothetical protein [Chitinophagales bacterium]
MSKYFILATLCSLMSYVNSYAQEELKSSWILDKVELSGFVSQELSFTQEESFFANYLDPSLSLDLSSSKLSIVVGGDELAYTYEVDGGTLIFSYLNTVYIQSNALLETKQTKGNTAFQFHLDAGKLILHRKNETFIERYTFSLAN